MAVRAGTHAQPAQSRGSLRALIERWGRDGDSVASVLESLGELGWFVLHGVDTPAGRLDHLAVGPAGVFTIETSTSGGRISVQTINERTFIDPWARARRVEQAIGHKVTPVLVYPHARLSRPVSRQRGVIVVMTKTLGEHLLRRRARLTDAEVHSLYHQLVGMSWSGAPATAAG
jgi:hypothetical protein